MATTISNDVVRIFPKQETLTAATTLKKNTRRETNSSINY